MHLTEEQKIKIKNIGKKYGLKLILLHQAIKLFVKALSGKAA